MYSESQLEKAPGEVRARSTPPLMNSPVIHILILILSFLTVSDTSKHPAPCVLLWAPLYISDLSVMDSKTSLELKRKRPTGERLSQHHHHSPFLHIINIFSYIHNLTTYNSLKKEIITMMLPFRLIIIPVAFSLHILSRLKGDL